MNVTALLKTLSNLLAGNERTEGGRRGETESKNRGGGMERWRDEKGENEEERS